MREDGMERWRDKSALVTGASSGIGMAIARDLAGAGMRVAAWARRASRLDALAAEVEQKGGTLMVREVDLRDEQAIAAGFEALRTDCGGVDVLVNNAGLGHKAPLLSAPPNSGARCSR